MVPILLGSPQYPFGRFFFFVVFSSCFFFFFSKFLVSSVSFFFSGKFPFFSTVSCSLSFSIFFRFYSRFFSWVIGEIERHLSGVFCWFFVVFGLFLDL